MKSEIYQAIKHSTNLVHVREGMFEVFQTISEAEPNQKIGYVSGLISSEGPQHIERNMRRLEAYTELVRKQYGFPVFSATDVFGNGRFGQIEEFYFEKELREQHFIGFWRAVLGSGHITDVMMTPRWEISAGAKEEFAIAQEKEMKIHIIEPVAGIEEIK